MTAIGIELGLRNVRSAVCREGVPQLILTDTGSNATPAAVWLSPSGAVVVGSVAYRKAAAARGFRRLMGTSQPVQVGPHNLLPEELTSLVIRKVVEDCEKTLRTAVDTAVLAVPANWKDGPRRATEAAGRLAGLRVERLINEPTAAAMAYGMRDDADGKTIAVYDLGGGTFDITLLRIHQKVFDVITSNGDDRLGGTDFDMKLMQLVLERLASRTGYTAPPEEAQDDKMRQRMRDLEWYCEETKKELSFVGESTVNVPFLDMHRGEPIGFEESISRADFEELIEDDVERTLQYMESALRAARLPRQAIDEIALVGGSSRIPLVRQRVADFFGKEPLTTAVNPDEAVALGAAIQAGIIGQDEVGEDSSVTLDMINNTLGVETTAEVGGRTVRGVFSPILAKGLCLPALRTETFATERDGQTTIEIRLFEGEAPVVEHNTLLDEIRISGLPLRPAGQVEVEVTFTKTTNDIIEVDWCVKGNQIRGCHVIPMRSGLHLADQLGRRAKVLDDLWHGVRPARTASSASPPLSAADWRSSPLAPRYATLIGNAERWVEAPGSAPIRHELQAALQSLKAAVVGGDDDRAEVADQRLTDLLFRLETNA